jgi:hypothetical protein
MMCWRCRRTQGDDERLDSSLRRKNLPVVILGQRGL